MARELPLRRFFHEAFHAGRAAVGRAVVHDPEDAPGVLKEFPPLALPGLFGRMTLSDTQTDRRPSQRRRRRDLHRFRVSPIAADRLSCMPLTTPVDRIGYVSVASLIARAFPVSQAGRHPRLHFRGLLKLHSRYGLPVCSPTIRGLCHEASIRPVTQSNRSIATKSYRQLLGWDLPPPVICAVGAH